MKTLWLVIQREYSTRVRKRSFILLTLLGPLLVALVYGGILGLMVSEGTPEITINVVDDSELQLGRQLIRENRAQNIHLVQTEPDYFKAQEKAGQEDTWDAVLYINREPLNVRNGINLMYAGNKPPQSLIRSLEWTLTKVIERYKLKLSKLDPDEYDSIRSQVFVHLEPIKGDGSRGTDVQGIVAFAASLLIYFFILMYGVQVLRGVLEEKTSRILEVMVSSVKPFQLMMGKIIGIGAVGLTQFLVWALISGIGIQVISLFFLGFSDPADIAQRLSEMEQYGANNQSEDAFPIGKVADLLAGTNFMAMGISFMLYFIFGYLLYASLFAAVGAMVDSESDTQQFMIPLTLPLVLAYAAALIVLMNPGSLAGKILSFVPFTSPVVMMVRIPYGTSILLEVLPSNQILILTYIGTTWLAARIYRVGILMYGRKPSFRDVLRWIKYK
ncbi:MAG: ABC transporter permease [Flavobacteriales bacterium]